MYIEKMEWEDEFPSKRCDILAPYISINMTTLLLVKPFLYDKWKVKVDISEDGKRIKDNEESNMNHNAPKNNKSMLSGKVQGKNKLSLNSLSGFKSLYR